MYLQRVPLVRSDLQSTSVCISLQMEPLLVIGGNHRLNVFGCKLGELGLLKDAVHVEKTT